MYENSVSVESSEVSALTAGPFLFVILALVVVMVVSQWKIFTKAGKPGWAAFVPIYNIYILTQIVGRPAWWILMLMIPFVNIIFGIMLAIDTAKAFGKSTVFGVFGLILFPFVGYPMLAFGNSTYTGAKAAAPAAPQA